MQAPTGLATLSVAHRTIGRIDPARFVEEAAAAGWTAQARLHEAARRTLDFMQRNPAP